MDVSTEGGASEAGVDAVRRALAPNEGGGEAVAIAAPAIAPTDDVADPQPAEPQLKGKAQQRAEQLLNLRGALVKLADRLEDMGASVNGETRPTRRMTNGIAAGAKSYSRFFPAFDKLIGEIETEALRAAKALDVIDENL